MYFHQIDFLTQSRFFLYSFIAGLFNGFIALILCSAAIKGKLKFISDILFCLTSVLLLVCTNIVFQDAALRVYEIAAFLSAGILVIILVKKRSDAIALKLFGFFEKVIWQPFIQKCKLLINKCKKLLKKADTVVYNFNKKFKEKFRSHAAIGKKEKQKKEEEKNREAGQTVA